MAIDFENDNPYAPPTSSGERSYDIYLSDDALKYLHSAGGWAMFIAMMNLLFVLFLASCFCACCFTSQL